MGKLDINSNSVSFPFDIAVLQSSLLLTLEPNVQFTGEELYGRYLDLHSHHETFTNIKGVEFIDYLSYLRRFSEPAEDLPDRLRRKDYQDYVAGLARYLCNFFRRCQPLVDLHQVLEPALAQAKDDEPSLAPYIPSTVGRSTETQTNGEPKEEEGGGGGGGEAEADEEEGEEEKEEGVNLEDYRSAKALEALGMDALKHELTRRGLKCGGTLAARAKRLFAVKGLAPDEYPAKLRAKTGPSNGPTPTAAVSGPPEPAGGGGGGGGGREVVGSIPDIPFASRAFLWGG